MAAELMPLSISLPTSHTLLSAQVAPSSSLRDLLAILLAESGEQAVAELCLKPLDGGELDPSRWAIQRVVRSRVWTGAELEGLGDRLLSLDISVTEALSQADARRPPANTTNPQLSDFLLTGHLHSPLLRLVYLPSHVTTGVDFRNVPGFPDCTWTQWAGAHSTVGELMESLVEELGIKKFLVQGTKTSRVEYCLQVAGADGEAKTESSGDDAVEGSDVKGADAETKTGTPGDGGEVDEVEEEGEPTLKGRQAEEAMRLAAEAPAPRPLGSTSTKARLSTLFSDWIAPEASKPAQAPTLAVDTPANKIRLVSEPSSLEESRDLSLRFMSLTNGKRTSMFVGGHAEEVEEEILDEKSLAASLDMLMDELGMKQAQREAMRKLPPDRQRFLVSQHRQNNSSQSSPLRPSKTGPEASTSDSGALAGLKRFSLWAAPPSASSPDVAPPPRRPTTTYQVGEAALPPPSKPTSTAQNLERDPQSWTSWWSAASNATGTGHAVGTQAKDTPQFYVDQVKSTKISQRRTDDQTDEDETVQTECIKCLRTLMNTEIGFEAVLSHANLITFIAYCLFTTSNKLRTQVADVLAALCVLSLQDGHKVVLEALTDFRVSHNEKFRFEYLIDSIRLKGRQHPTEDESDSPDVEDESALWEYRTAAMSLINSISNSPEDLEDRIALREEFTRRGLNECLAVLRYRGVLREELDTYIAETNALRSLPLDRNTGAEEKANSFDKTDKDNFTGVIQRLVQKEKEVLQLQSNIAQLSKSSKVAGDDADTRRAEKGRRWEGLMDEINKNKLHISELEATVETRDKEIKYLKRVLEAVYSRFHEKSTASTTTDPATSSARPLEATLDPDVMATRSIEALAKKEEEIASLKSELAAAKAESAARLRLPKAFARQAPPPPPPPPSSSGMLLQYRHPFFWNKLSPDSATPTVWGEIDVATLPRLDFHDLEASFDATTPKKVIVKQTTSIQRKTVTTVLSITRAQNVAIMLARFKMPNSSIRDAVLFFDDSKLSLDNLKAIKHFVPTADEAEAITSYNGDFSALSSSDQYFKEMLVIPRLGERLSCMLMRRRLEMDMEELKPELTILRCAADELKASTKLKTILASVLAIGNALNASNFRGNARGFQLDSLLKLKETRAVSDSGPTPTLLHYLVKVLLRADETLLGFLDDCPHVEAASRVSFATVMGSVHSLVAGVASVEEEIRVLKELQLSPPGDRFLPVMESFARQAVPAIDALKALGSKLDADLRLLLQYYGEDATTSKSEELFQLVADFSASLLRAESEVRAAEPKEQPSPSTPRGTSSSSYLDVAPSPRSSGRSSIGRGGFDEAIRELRSGGTRRQRSSYAASSNQRPLSRVFHDGSR
ncbi:hypothetical protein MNV49_000407 [Pseudohyphozyma bogoriensis]|nr:hypothetical protein MNV49_000407 [Pseudohyphozyma bogoriensis]